MQQHEQWYTNWRKTLDEQQQKEVQFAEAYNQKFNHGTDGHSRLMLISLMAYLLDCLQDEYLSYIQDHPEKDNSHV